MEEGIKILYSEQIIWKVVDNLETKECTSRIQRISKYVLDKLGL